MNSRPLLLGHRGARKYAAENSFAAFDLAIEHGCDGFEFDVRYTRDARCVICHDALYRRRRIVSRSFAELSLPDAEEVIQKYGSRAFLDIELKTPGDAGPILRALAEARAKHYIISSFLPEVLHRVAAENVDVPLGLICETFRQLRRWPKLPIGAVIMNWRLADKSLIDELHSARLQTFIWTVNSRREMERLRELGVDGIISDDTKLLVATIRPRNEGNSGLQIPKSRNHEIAK
ncbi:MAG TPA: glycerophosphodiester phosphodiesterase [Terriglobales bacterium]|nr:glycerophosphodiester phosphodiesterase [Terriglobales bacterium]